MENLQAQQPPMDRSFSLDRGAFKPVDQSSMTIEFLRARLLSARSDSKLARQQVQLLAGKVVELEKQIELEIQLQKELERARLEALSKYKKELMPEYGHLFLEQASKAFEDKAVQNENRKEDIMQVQDENEKEDIMQVREENGKENIMQVQNDEDDKDGAVTDLTDREKGLLTWVRRKESKRPSTGWFRRPRWLETASTDGDLSQKRWTGKSVRQIRKKENRIQGTDPEDNSEKPPDLAIVEFAHACDAQITLQLDGKRSMGMEAPAELVDDKVEADETKLREIKNKRCCQEDTFLGQPSKERGTPFRVEQATVGEVPVEGTTSINACAELLTQSEKNGPVIENSTPCKVSKEVPVDNSQGQNPSEMELMVTTVQTCGCKSDEGVADANFKHLNTCDKGVLNKSEDGESREIIESTNEDSDGFSHYPVSGQPLSAAHSECETDFQSQEMRDNKSLEKPMCASPVEMLETQSSKIEQVGVKTLTLHDRQNFEQNPNSHTVTEDGPYEELDLRPVHSHPIDRNLTQQGTFRQQSPVDCNVGHTSSHCQVNNSMCLPLPQYCYMHEHLHNRPAELNAMTSNMSQNRGSRVPFSAQPVPWERSVDHGRVLRNRHRMSMDAGLDRVTEVLRALQVAKLHVTEASGGQVMSPKAAYYPPQFAAGPSHLYSPSPSIMSMQPSLGAFAGRVPGRGGYSWRSTMEPLVRKTWQR